MSDTATVHLHPTYKGYKRIRLTPGQLARLLAGKSIRVAFPECKGEAVVVQRVVVRKGKRVLMEGPVAPAPMTVAMCIQPLFTIGGLQ